VLGVAIAFAACASSGHDGSDGGGGNAGGGGPGTFGGSGLGQTECSDAGCSCVRIASIGKPGHYGVAGDDTAAFTDWLNSKSNASVDMVTSQPTLTADFLSHYDVIVIQWLTDSNSGPYWTFSDDEIRALQNWVQSGGGLITLSGYDSNAQEVVPLNQLLSFTDISYNTDTVLASCPSSLDCYCWGNSVPLGGWAGAPIGANVTQVGALDGRSIRAGSATVDCSDPSGLVYAVHETVGHGRIFSYADEWVTYSSQWLGTAPANESAIYTDPNNPCYGKSAAEVFQVPQFWFNALAWVSGKSCFTISDPGVVQ